MRALGVAPPSRAPRTCALCKSFDPALLGWRILIGVLLSWSRPTFLQSWNGLYVPMGFFGCADTVYPETAWPSNCGMLAASELQNQ